MKKNKFLDLGKQPIANGFLYEDQIKDEYFYNLAIGYAPSTSLVTHMEYVDPPLMFNDQYTYRGSMSKTMQNHFKNFSEYLRTDVISTNPKILDVGCANGTNGRFLIHNQQTKLVYGIEYCPEMASEADKFYDKVFL